MIRIRCTTHGHWLKHVSAGGTTWRDSRYEARVYGSGADAREDAKRATWLKHTPEVVLDAEGPCTGCGTSRERCDDRVLKYPKRCCPSCKARGPVVMHEAEAASPEYREARAQDYNDDLFPRY